jgi:hypothetical protein
MTTTLCYFIAPVINYSIVEFNLQAIAKYVKKFDRVIVCVATGEGCRSVEEVHQSLKVWEVEYETLVIKNSTALRDAASLPALFQASYQHDPVGITFFAHAKGVSRVGEQLKAVKVWTDSMLCVNLTDFNLVRTLFSTGSYDSVGMLRKLGKTKHLAPRFKWHYSGSFYWIKNAFLPKLSTIKPYGWLAEGFPGEVVPLERSFCLCLNNIQHTPYRLKSWARYYMPSLEKFKQTLQES